MNTSATARTATVLALLGAAGISAIALNDAATFALTGQYSAASDEFGLNPLFVLSGIVHGLAYLAFTAVLHLHRHRVDAGSRFRRVVRVVLSLALVALAAGMLGSTAVSMVQGEVVDSGALGALAGINFLLMFVGGVMLGFALLRRRELRPAAITLVAIVPAILLVILLAAVGSPWAHPAYAEVMVGFGLAFIGLTPRPRPALADGGVVAGTVRAPA
ncbi:hypothetical protein [Pseudactinotalea sp. Z1732]|uniref:hypothetical protein n=1 Tax=Micrococcales TaxID=85006 RepID=UPI003C7E94F3